MSGESLSLEGMVALVTGAARGQGRSHALALAAAGATVVACDVPGAMKSPAYPLATRHDLDEAVRVVEGLGGQCVGLAVDVRDPAAVDEAVSGTVARFGRLDILLANAAIVTTGPLWTVDDVSWQELVDTNLSGVFHCLRAAVPHMLERQFGRVVVTSSMGGRMGVPNLSAYNATKWGLIGMAKSLALEVAKSGITVNVVCPTTVATPMVLNESMYRLYGAKATGDLPEDPASLPDEILDRFRRVNPIPRAWLDPGDITRAVMYLITDPGVITGSVLEVGLGSSARLH
jgi:SDR family mycofactocin-dependent oxidoreductase